MPFSVVENASTKLILKVKLLFDVCLCHAEFSLTREVSGYVFEDFMNSLGKSRQNSKLFK